MKSPFVTRSAVGTSPRAAQPRLSSLLALTSVAALLGACQEKYYETTIIAAPQTEAGTLQPDPTHTATASHVPSMSLPDAHTPGATDAGKSDAAITPVPDAAPTDAPMSDAHVAPVDAALPDAGHTTDVPDTAPPLPDPLEPGAPVVNSTPAKQADFDMFGVMGNRYWFVVDPVQVDNMNQNRGGGPVQNGDIYVPGGVQVSNANYADHLLVTSAADHSTADYGKVQTRVVGQSTWAPWSVTSIPNLKVDADEFVDQQRVGGFEHFRFNNAQIGSIFREKLTLDLFKKFNYPSLRTNYAWVSSTVWGAEIAVPYILVESYKRPFCDNWADELGGGCVNMWEGVGDPMTGGWYYGGGGGHNWFSDEQNCQFSECDSSRAGEFVDAYNAAPRGDGFKAALSEFVDWPAFHKFQCLEWILTIGDDMFHNGNNVTVVERADGKFQFLPWSVDISLGQSWYPVVPLASDDSSIARGCQEEKQCWADMIAVCETELQTFIDSDPVGMLDDVYHDLETEGMLRPGDDDRYDSLRGYIAQRLVDLPDELELNRDEPYNPYGNSCGYYGYNYVDCGGICVPRDQCQVCEPEPNPETDGGVADAGPPKPELDAGGPKPEVDASAVDAASFQMIAPPPDEPAADAVIVVPPPGTDYYGYYQPPAYCQPPAYPYYGYNNPKPPMMGQAQPVPAK